MSNNLNSNSLSQGEVRICKKDYDDDRAKQYGPLDRWYHLKCFADNREQLMFFCSGSNLAGLNTLSQEDQVWGMSCGIMNY